MPDRRRQYDERSHAMRALDNSVGPTHDPVRLSKVGSQSHVRTKEDDMNQEQFKQSWCQLEGHLKKHWENSRRTILYGSMAT